MSESKINKLEKKNGLREGKGVTERNRAQKKTNELSILKEQGTEEKYTQQLTEALEKNRSKMR